MVNKKQMFSYLTSRFNTRRSSGGWYRINNPFDSKSKGYTMGIHPQYNVVQCFRTGYKNSMYGFILEISGEPNIGFLENHSEVEFTHIEESSINVDVNLPEGFQLLPSTDTLGDLAMEYIIGRGISEELVIDKSIGFCNHGKYLGYLIVPFINRNQLEYFSARSFLLHQPKHTFEKKEDMGVGKSEVIYNEDALHMYEQVGLGEGIFDALTYGKYGICGSGWSLSKKQLSKIINSSCKVINIAADKGFYKKALHTASKMFEHKEVRVASMEHIEGLDSEVDVNSVGLDGLEFKKVTWSILAENL